MLDEHGLRGDERALMLAATMIEVARERHNFSDAEMDTMIGLALAVLFSALAGDPQAQRAVLDATGRLNGTINRVDDATYNERVIQ